MAYCGLIPGRTDTPADNALDSGPGLPGMTYFDPVPGRRLSVRQPTAYLKSFSHGFHISARPPFTSMLPQKSIK
jgi:hypothetical protein